MTNRKASAMIVNETMLRLDVKAANKNGRGVDHR